MAVAFDKVPIEIEPDPCAPYVVVLFAITAARLLIPEALPFIIAILSVPLEFASEPRDIESLPVAIGATTLRVVFSA
jgi:hypothetical protein